MATIPWLADELRTAGLTVVEHPGWKTHARPGAWEPRYGIVHATAAPRTQPDDVQVRVVRNGRGAPNPLPGPIANACVDRRGNWHVLAAGRCNTTVPGGAGPYEGLGNTNALGVEACNDNGLHDPPEPWPDVQYRSYVRGWAAIARRLGWKPDQLRGHKEHCPGHKTDPTFSMATFRGDVAAVLAGKDTDAMPELDDVVWTKTNPDGSKDERTFREILVAADARTDYLANRIGLDGDLEHVKTATAALTARVEQVYAAATNDGQTPVDIRPEAQAGLAAATAAGVLEGLATLDADVAAQALVTVLGAERARALGQLLVG